MKGAESFSVLATFCEYYYFSYYVNTYFIYTAKVQSVSTHESKRFDLIFFLVS